jgi:glycosidase
MRVKYVKGWTHKRFFYLIVLLLGASLACTPAKQETTEINIEPIADITTMLPTEPQGKPVVYQVFTRLFGNKNQRNKPWGTIEENGVGKFSDITDTALQGIKQMGVTHIWYTGVPHHDVIRDYRAFGISDDDPDVVKGRAGSPYAVKDYYSVDPDLANDPASRMAEFAALIERTHRNGMQVIIDIVPNHVARNYHSLNNPQGISDFGQHDDKTVEYRRDNNFYYVVGEDFKVPKLPNGYQPLGGEPHPLSDGKFEESPAKWTGNGSRLAQPSSDDWYETVKVNYGVKPDGSYDFPRLPEQYLKLGINEHQAFWADKAVPDSWQKFREIAQFWLAKGVDGFRYDMAEMVPVEFWSYLNSSIKTANPKTFLLAEVYNRDLYRDYIQLGKMDYLYDKVDFYDSVKAIMQGKESSQKLHYIQDSMADIESHMLHFLENHDEQRIPSDDFAGQVGGAQMGKPALVVSALISRSPTLIYFGQEVGEDGSEEMGYGKPSRTTIFDYAGVPAHQRWMNEGKFDGGQLSPDEQALRDYYVKVMLISAYHPAMLGQYRALPMQPNYLYSSKVNEAGQYQRLGYESAAKVLAFVRYTAADSLLIISHFSEHESVNISLPLSPELIQDLKLGTGKHDVSDLLTGQKYSFDIDGQRAIFNATLAPMQSLVIRLK